MDERFEDWLLRSRYDPMGAKSRMSNLRRVEAAYGDLDRQFERDRFRSLLRSLSYSTADKRSDAVNPSRIEIDGDIYNGLATLRSAIRKYGSFLESSRPRPTVRRSH